MASSLDTQESEPTWTLFGNQSYKEKRHVSRVEHRTTGFKSENFKNCCVKEVRVQ